MATIAVEQITVERREQTSKSVPTFAVVGRVNKGKSSIVSALTEKDEIAIGADPGTTVRSTPFHLEHGGRRLFTVVDTPGFQRPEAAYAWISARVENDADAPEAVAAFVHTFEGSGEFRDECRLLRPILDGAHVLFVVDASQPWGQSYELEAKILRWSGRPRIALLNHTTAESHADEWRRQLSPYFNVVRGFNAHQSKFGDRISLLMILSELDESTRAPLREAVRVLTERQEDRRRQASGVIAVALYDMLTLKLSKPRHTEELANATDRARLFADMAGEFATQLRLIEARARKRIEEIYDHHRLERDEHALATPLFDQDIFAEQTWSALGLSKQQLLLASAVSGAATGGAIDMAVAGHSFMIGTIIGGLLGAAGGLAATTNSPELYIGGLKLSGGKWLVGPIKNPNFAWIAIDRALLHFRSIVTRSHARRDRERLDDGGGIVGNMPLSERNAIGRILAQMTKGRADEEKLAELRRYLGRSLAALEPNEY